MATYKNIPCGYADATLLALAENLGTGQIFTVDSHFYAYRLSNGNALRVVPGSES